MDKNKLKYCIKNFLPSNFDYNTLNLNKYLNTYTNFYNYRDARTKDPSNQILKEEFYKILMQFEKEQNAIKDILIPYIENFIKYLNTTLKTDKVKIIDEQDKSLIRSALRIVIENENTAEGELSQVWHVDELDEYLNVFSREVEPNINNTRHVTVPLSLPIINTRIPFNQSDCDLEGKLEKRDFFTCRNWNRGSATYFDARLCHRGPNKEELKNINRITLLFQVFLPNTNEKTFSIEDEYKALKNYDANKHFKTGGKVVRKSLDKCTVTELKERANKRGIKITGLKKQEIIDKLRNKNK